MRRINYEPANQDMPVTGEILDLVPARRGFSRRGETALGTMVENALIAAGYDHCQALLTKAALEHTGALSCMAAAPYRGLKGGESMTYEDIVMLIVAAVVFCLFSIVSTALFIKESDRCCRLRSENQKLRRLIEQRIQMDSDCLNAYCAMLREASRSDTKK